MGLLTGVAMGSLCGLSVGTKTGLAIGLLSGVAFGLAMACFFAIQRGRFALARPELTGEDVLHDGPANHFLNGEGVGGWLFLTKERVVFRSHQFNIQPHELSVPLTEITDVQDVRLAKVFPTGLRFVTRSGNEEWFVVEDNRRWRDEIVKAKA